MPLPFPPHVAENVREARRLHDLVGEQGRNGFWGIVQGEKALAKLEHGHDGDESLEQIYERPNAFHRPFVKDVETDAKPGDDEEESNP